MESDELDVLTIPVEAHRPYTRMKNFAEVARWYLFQEGFRSCVVDGSLLMTAVRYVELNPVRAVMHPSPGSIRGRPRGFMWGLLCVIRW